MIKIGHSFRHVTSEPELGLTLRTGGRQATTVFVVLRRSLVCSVASIFMISLLCVSPAMAIGPEEALKDPKLEIRARNLSAELRCLVCQNQSIDDSDAPLAKDLRLIVRQRLLKGDTDADIRDFVVARYGEFVLLRPRFTVQTVVLWLSPVLFLALGIFAARKAMRMGAPATDGVAPLTESESAQLKEIIGGDVIDPGSQTPERQARLQAAGEGGATGSETQTQTDV